MALDKIMPTGETGESARVKINASIDAVSLLKSMPLPQFMDGQHTNQVKIIRGVAATVETILFADATLAVETYTFTLSEEVNLPATFHIELKDGGDSAAGAMVGNLEITAVNQEAYGGGRYGPLVTDYYFKGTLLADKIELQLTLLRPVYKDGATQNLQLTVNEHGLPHNVVSSEWVDEQITKGHNDHDHPVHPEPPPPLPPPYAPEEVKIPVSGNDLTIAECILGFKETVTLDWTMNKDFYIEDTTGKHQVFSVMYIADGAVSEVDHGRFVYEQMIYAQ